MVEKISKFLKQIDSPHKVLPALLVLLTDHNRYLPKIEWSNKSWTHNIFRVYEMIFWRREGIRPEISSSTDGKTVKYQAHSFEGLCALTEQYVREWLKSFKLIPFKIVVMKANTGNVMAGQSLPFYFAIAIDSNVGGIGSSSATSASWSHTCSGSNLTLYCLNFILSTTDPTATYGGVGFNLAGAYQSYLRVHYLVNPNTGSNTISIGSYGGSAVVSMSSISFSGSDTASPYNTITSVRFDGASTSSTLSVAATASGQYILGYSIKRCASYSTAGITITSGSTYYSGYFTSSNPNWNYGHGYLNSLTTGSGNYNLTFNNSESNSSNAWFSLGFAVIPYVSTGPTSRITGLGFRR